MWALRQGVAAGHAPLLLFTDADIVHDPRHLSALVARLQAPQAGIGERDGAPELLSLAERALVPAFVYFFQMLYPFAKVNDPRSRVAAAAGGTILIRREALERIGGIEAIKGALIDDVALAKAVKPGGAIFLGHSGLAVSIRTYPGFVDLWRMISRTAFTQLRHSAALLVLTLLGLACGMAGPRMGGGVRPRPGTRLRARRARARGAKLFADAQALRAKPALGARAAADRAFYMAATVGSALDHWRGVGARWKNRAYGAG